LTPYNFFVFFAPDLVIEVLSPSTYKNDWNYKFNLYEQAGVREYWLVNPKTRVINIFLLQPDGRYGLGSEYDYSQIAPVYLFDGLEIELSKVFVDV
jgi:Uma2 family endonuclease